MAQIEVVSVPSSVTRLAVLVRAHRAGIDVDVRSILQRDPVAMALEQRPYDAGEPLPSDEPRRP